MAAPAFGTRFPDGWSKYTDGDTSSLQSATPAAVTGVAGFVTGTAMRIALPANNDDGTPNGTPGAGASAPAAGDNHQRCEVEPNVAGLGAVSSDGDLHNGATGYFGLAIKLDAAFPTTTTTWQVVTQWKNDGTGTPPFELKVGNGNLYLDGNSGAWSITVCPVAPGGVYGIVIGATFTEDPTTSTVSAWVNGTKYVTNAHPSGSAGFLYPGIGDYWKTGIYRDSAIRSAATVWYGALAHDSAYQPVADYIAGSVAATAGQSTSDAPTGTEQSAPAETRGVGLVGGDRASGADQGSPGESYAANQGHDARAHGAEQGSPTETQTGAAISNTPVTSPDAAEGAEQSTGDTEGVDAGTSSISGELPTVLIPPALRGSPGSAPVTYPQHFTLGMTLLPSGSYAAVPQDSSDDVVSCVAALLGTRVGELLEVPGFGVPDATFMSVGDHWAAVLEAAVARWEPRAAGAAIPVVINEDGTATVQVGIPTTPGGPAA